ncbi:MAG: primosomal protein N', partial [Bdellovibrionales bacterium]|nr:primosomal protein N' [Bdellovibrionales bacterium]
HPVFPAEQLDLFRWMADYYGASLPDVIASAVPRRSDVRVKNLVQLKNDALEELSDPQSPLCKSLQRSPAQQRVIDVLRSTAGAPDSAELCRLAETSASSIQALAKKGVVEFVQPSMAEILTRAHARQTPSSNRPGLTPSQKSCFDAIQGAISAERFEPFLLLGVTGSGKTEVYLRAIEETLRAGKTALVIVPEIALTPQLFDQFQSRLDLPLALLHSQVGETLRWQSWQAVLSGEVRVAVGARSAVFAPMPNLGLLIVDEEHETSYKQSDGLRYHARDVALKRAELSGCPLVLGSATPSFESLLAAAQKRYRLLEMPERVTARPLPEIEVVNLSEIKRKDMPSENISPALAEALHKTLTKKGQAVILYNRRGFSSFLQCNSCGEAVQCPNCSVSMTFHKRSNRLVCHYCDRNEAPPSHCRYCRDPKRTAVEIGVDGTAIKTEKARDKVGSLSHRGGGTERVVDELQLLFPEARIVRMDRDTVTRKDAYREILGAMRSGEAD